MFARVSAVRFVLLSGLVLLAASVPGPIVSAADKGVIHGLLVGVNKYTNGMRSLNYAEKDVYDFSRLPLDAGAHRDDVVVLTIAPEELSLYAKRQVSRHVATKVGSKQTPRLLGDLTGAISILRPAPPI